eukprot:279151_1
MGYIDIYAIIIIKHSVCQLTNHKLVHEYGKTLVDSDQVSIGLLKQFVQKKKFSPSSHPFVIKNHNIAFLLSFCAKKKKFSPSSHPFVIKNHNIAFLLSFCAKKKKFSP